MSEEITDNPQTVDISSPILCSLYNEWQIRCDHNGKMLQGLFSLTDFPEHLDFMSVIDYEPRTGRFKARYVGSNYVEGFGADNTGRYFDDIPVTDDILARFKALVLMKRSYLVTDNRLTWSPKNYKSYNSLVFPLFDDLGDVVRVVVRIEFVN